MSPDQIADLVERAASEGSRFPWWVWLVTLAVAALGSFGGSYLRDRAKNLATKQDIGDITHEIEQVKAQIRSREEIDSSRRAMKLEACLSALEILDADLSSRFAEAGALPQKAKTAEGRLAHSKLILSCDNPDIAKEYMMILTASDEEERGPLTDQLNAFRNLVREELGFGKPVDADRDRAWLGKLASDDGTDEADDDAS